MRPAPLPSSLSRGDRPSPIDPRGADLTLELVAVQALAPGDELFISYIDETRPWRERQALLARGYQFQCHCARCAADEAAARAPAADLARYRAGDV